MVAADLSLGSYVRSFGFRPRWEALVAWPPDVFALTNLVLDHTEAYRFAVAPQAGHRWPPSPQWNASVVAASRRWREAAACGGPAPLEVQVCWDVVLRHRSTSLEPLRTGQPTELCDALLTLHAIADETCAGLTVAEPEIATCPFEAAAWRLLAETGSLSHIAADRIRVTPKTHLATRGVTIRSFSRYLCLLYEALDVRWRRVPSTAWVASSPRRHAINAVLLPWPMHVSAGDFHEVAGPLDNMDPSAFGFFEFDPSEHVDFDRVDRMLTRARDHTRRIDIVIMPEGALVPDEAKALEDVLDAHGVTFVIAGARAPSGDGHLGRNYLHIAVRSNRGWSYFEQAKHHRWCLDESQLRQYHLTRALDPRKRWWEAIDLPPRVLEIIDVGGGTAAPLVCEDLARMDEVSEVLRRIGPALVVAVLLDGPQLVSRWPFRYASVLADEPGSAVLTLTSLGMATRCVPPGACRCRVVGLWNDPARGVHELALEPRASGLLVRASLDATTTWTADGRRHDGGAPDVALKSVHQLHDTQRRAS